MKIVLLLIFFTGLCPISNAQDPALQERASLILKATDAADIDKILDLTYPKLFTIVPREDMAKAITEAFDTEDYTISLDSILVDTIFPIFIVGDGNYAKLKHSQILKLKFKEEIDTTDKDNLEELMNNMKVAFPDSKVNFDPETNTVLIAGHGYMIAIKDSYAKEWCFVNFEDENNSLTPLLFSKEVLDKLKEF